MGRRKRLDHNKDNGRKTSEPIALLIPFSYKVSYFLSLRTYNHIAYSLWPDFLKTILKLPIRIKEEKRYGTVNLSTPRPKDRPFREANGRRYILVEVLGLSERRSGLG